MYTSRSEKNYKTLHYLQYFQVDNDFIEIQMEEQKPRVPKSFLILIHWK